MVQKITLFEPHFDGAQFGPAAMGRGFGDETDEEPAASDEVETVAEGTTGSRARRVALALTVASVAFVAGRLAVRWYRSDGEQLTFEDVEAAEEEIVQ